VIECWAPSDSMTKTSRGAEKSSHDYGGADSRSRRSKKQEATKAFKASTTRYASCFLLFLLLHLDSDTQLQVVPDFSSSLNDPLEKPETIDANHMDMCRFSGPDDPGYQQVGGELSSWISELNLVETSPSNPEQPVQGEQLNSSVSY
jgi:hypothetical protein